MDLQLHGSQINLATRDKRPTPAVRYPLNYRPGSASVATTINRSSLSLRGRPRRPQSADTFILRNNLSSGFNFLGENFTEKSKLKRPLSSSSNLLNILLSEQIKRSWSTPEPDLSSDCSLGRKIKTRTSSQMDVHSDGGEASSVEEDIRGDLNDDKVNEIYRTNRVPKKLKKSKPRYAGNSLNRDNIAHTDSAKKFVTFGHTHFAENLSLPSHSTNSGSDDQEKPDLLGRVSFSKNDVYEIDFSDYENDGDILADFSSPSTNKMLANKLIKSSTIDKTQEEDSKRKSQNFCCSLKCNSMACTVDECDTVSNDKVSIKSGNAIHHESNAVIEEYKKEIESINRKHENDVAEKKEFIDI